MSSWYCSILLFFSDCEQVDFRRACVNSEACLLGSNRSFIFKCITFSWCFLILYSFFHLRFYKRYIFEAKSVNRINTSIFFFLLVLLLLILHLLKLNYFTYFFILSLLFFKSLLFLFLSFQSFLFNLFFKLKFLLVLLSLSFNLLFIRVKDRYFFVLNFLKWIVFLHCAGTLRVDDGNWSLKVLRRFGRKQVFHCSFINVG